MIADTSRTTGQPRLSLPRTVADCLLPLQKRDSLDWLCKNYRNKDGVVFSKTEYPWVRGICEAWDNPETRIVALCFAARLGKTTTGHGLFFSAIQHDPRPAMLGAPTETLLGETVADKVYPAMRKSPLLARMLPKHGKPPKKRINLIHSVIYGAWSGSDVSLSDKDPHILHGGEIDKWDKKKSDEGDPLALFLERGREVPTRKVILESTPTVRGKSRIHNWLLRGTNNRYNVPCPHCGKHLAFELGRSLERFTGKARVPSIKGGLKFELNSAGKIDEDIAERTAWYQCPHCGGRIEDHHKRMMCKRGLWVPEGCSVRKGKVVGTPHVGPTIESFQLNRFYAPTFTFGDMARGYAEHYHTFSLWQNYVNSWLGDVVAHNQVQMEWGDVAKRLYVDYKPGRVHNKACFLTCGVDVQIDHLVYVVVGWSEDQAGYLVDYGTARSWEELRSQVLSRDYQAENGDWFRIQMTLVDARDGNRTSEVCDFCATVCRPGQRWVWPCMGSRTALSQTFTRTRLGEIESQKDRKDKSFRGMYLINVNTPYWQTWIDGALYRHVTGEQGSLAIHHKAADDQDFIEQLQNESWKDGKWQPVNSQIPWDFRDATRYSRCAADVNVNGNWSRVFRKPFKLAEVA